MNPGDLVIFKPCGRMMPAISDDDIILYFVDDGKNIDRGLTAEWAPVKFIGTVIGRPSSSHKEIRTDDRSLILINSRVFVIHHDSLEVIS